MDKSAAVARLNELGLTHQRPTRMSRDAAVDASVSRCDDWNAVRASRRGELRREVRGGLQATRQHLDAHKELGIADRRTLEAKRATFTRELQQTIDDLHRRQVPFTHLPRRRDSSPGEQRNKERERARVRRCHDEEFVGPTVSLRARELLERRLAARTTVATSKAAAADAAGGGSTSGNEFLDGVLTTSFSPRRSRPGDAPVKDVDTAVHRAWFNTAVVPVEGDAATPTTHQALGVTPAKHDPTQATASFLLRQGVVPETKLHRGDGYVSPRTLRQLKQEYCREKHGYRAPPERPRRLGNALTPQPQGSVIDLTGVFTHPGDIGTYVRRDAREAANGLLRADERRSLKTRLGGTSSPR